ncbi:MAG: aldolase [Rhodobacteraceae bacterium]|nr:MAG: aldolase [Paracoccaceae bacterium]
MNDEACELCRYGAALAAQGLARAGSGNISVRLADGRILISPSGEGLGSLRPDAVSVLDPDGRHLDGPAPSKEAPLHLAIYVSRPLAGAVVHLHTPYATAWSMVAGHDPSDCLPALTPYSIMRLGRVALLPFAVPGSSVLGDWVRAHATHHSAFLLANHGPVVSAKTLKDAVFAAEELEETARLALLLKALPHRALGAADIDAIEATFGDRYR